MGRPSKRDSIAPPVTLIDGVTVPRADNPWYPLPPDYPELTDDGKRQARVNACCLRGSPEEFVTSWAFFRATYLEPTDDGFFYRRKLPSPPAHYQMVDDIFRYRSNVHAAPRGSAKSTVIGKEIPLLFLLTNPHFKVMEVMSTGKEVNKRGGEFQTQLEENEYIIQDFGVQRPPKGGKQWTLSYMQLNNGASLEGVSVDGRKRGGRPDLIVLDDPEYDPESPTQETALRAHLERLVFRQLLPMFDTSFQTFEWIGTLISCKSALYAALKGSDPRFLHFNRRLYSVTHFDQTAKQTVYFWPEKWDEKGVENLKSKLGDSAFEAEMQNNPVSDKSKLFKLHDEYHTYSIIGDDVTWITPPNNQRNTMKYDAWLNGLARIMVVDVPHTVSATSDYASILVAGIDAEQCWWMLDLYLERCLSDKLLPVVIKMGYEWQPTLIGVESAAGQESFKSWIEAEIANKSTVRAGWVPRAIWPIRYPARLSKEDRISALEPRVSRYKLRLPAHLRERWPMCELWRQFTLYTPDGQSLDHDDAIDTVAMIPYCPRMTPTGLLRPEALIEDAFALLERGEITDPRTGIPIGHGLDISRVPWGILRKFLDAREGAAYNIADEHDRTSGSSLVRQSPWRDVRPSRAAAISRERVTATRLQRIGHK